MPGFDARAQAGQDRPHAPGHRRAVLRRRPGARRRTCSASRAAARLPDAQPAAGAALDGGRAAVASAERALELDARVRPARTGVRPADRRASRHNRFALAELPTEIDVARVYVDRCIAAHSAGELTAVEAAARSTGPPSSSSASWTAACSSTAATATWRSTRSRACGATRACSASTAGPTRSMKEIVGGSLGLR